MTRLSISLGRLVAAMISITMLIKSPVANSENFSVCRTTSISSFGRLSCETTITPSIASGVTQSTRRRIDSAKLTDEIAQTRRHRNRDEARGVRPFGGREQRLEETRDVEVAAHKR